MLTCLLHGHTAVSRAPRSGFLPNPGVWPSQLDSATPAVTTTPSHSSVSTSSKPTATSSQSSAHRLNQPPFIFPIEPRLQSKTCDPPASPASSPAFPPFLTQAVLFKSSAASTSLCFPTQEHGPRHLSLPLQASAQTSPALGNFPKAKGCPYGKRFVFQEHPGQPGSHSALWRAVIID